jgi:hypothetical protein
MAGSKQTQGVGEAGGEGQKGERQSEGRVRVMVRAEVMALKGEQVRDRQRRGRREKRQ